MSATPFGNASLYPSITVEVGFASSLSGFGVWDDAGSMWDSALWGPDVVWTDISAYVRRVSTSRGWSREQNRASPATLTIDLSNADGRFTSANTSGPYVAGGVTQIRARVPIRLRATWNSVTYDLFRGRVTSWTDTFPGLGADCMATVTAIDLLPDLGRVKLASAVSAGAGEYAGARIERILNAAGWVGGTSLDTGQNTMQATTLGDSALNLCQLTADSDAGLVFCDGSGAVVYQDFNHPFSASRSTTTQITLASNWDDLVTANDDAGLVNTARYTRVGGSAQTVTNAESVALNGETTDERTDLICETDAQAEDVANVRVLSWKDPEYRVVNVRVTPARDPSTLWPLVLDAEFRDLHVVSFTHPGGFAVSRQVHVASITHEVSDDGWRVQFGYTSAAPFAPYWGDGLWDDATWDTSLWWF